MSGTLLRESRRELAHRVRDGLEVTLYWDPCEHQTSVELWHAATGATLAFDVPCERALDAFYHPFAHLPEPYGLPFDPEDDSP